MKTFSLLKILVFGPKKSGEVSVRGSNFVWTQMHFCELWPTPQSALLTFAPVIDVLSTSPQPEAPKPEAPISEVVGLTRATGRLRLSKVFETVMSNLANLPVLGESLVQASPQHHSCDSSVQTSPLMHVDAETQTELVELVTLADLRTEMRALLVGLGF